MSSLDMELIFVDILPRLSIKSLMRFKCVSESFQSAISSNKFAKQYLRRFSISPEVSDLLLITRHPSIYCYNLNQTGDYSKIIIESFAMYARSVNIVGSSNGLLCILAVDHSIAAVVNPITHICKFVNFSSNGYVGYNNLGFAFDHKNLDYKLVAISDGPNETRTTRVYSLNSNSWRVIENVVPVGSIKRRRDGVLIDNHLLHWIFWNRLLEGTIGCFDVCTMTWTNDILFPRYYYHSDYMIRLLDFGVFDDCLFSSFKIRVDFCIDVWMMKEYGVQDSWFKLFSIPIPKQGGVVPIVYRQGSDEILIQRGQSNTLFWYNSKNSEMRDAEYLGTPKFPNLSVYMCRPSLVDVPRGDPLGRFCLPLYKIV